MVEYDNQTPQYTDYKYNAAGDLLTVKDPSGNITRMSYDTRGLLQELKDPDLGDWKYFYDPSGNLEKKEFYADGGTTPKSTISYIYDKINRATKESFSNVANTADQTTEYQYDSKKPDSTDPAPLFCKGRLYSVSRDNIIIKNNEYDAMGRALKVTKTVDNVNYVTSYKYDCSGAVVTALPGFNAGIR